MGRPAMHKVQEWLLNSWAQRAQKPLWAKTNCKVGKQSGWEGRFGSGFFPKASAHSCRWKGAPGGLDPCASVGSVCYILVLWGKHTTVHCSAIQREHTGLHACRESAKKHLSITFCLKNSQEPLQLSVTSWGITKIGILHLSYAIHPQFSNHICYCYFSFKLKGGKTRDLGKNWLLHTSISLLLLWRKLQSCSCCEQCVTVAILNIPDKWQEHLQNSWTHKLCSKSLFITKLNYVALFSSSYFKQLLFQTTAKERENNCSSASMGKLFHREGEHCL